MAYVGPSQLEGMLDIASVDVVSRSQSHGDPHELVISASFVMKSLDGGDEPFDIDDVGASDPSERDQIGLAEQTLRFGVVIGEFVLEVFALKAGALCLYASAHRFVIVNWVWLKPL